MSQMAYTYIHVCVYTRHILEMEDTCAIFNWNDQKNFEKGELITKWIFKMIFKGKGCKYCISCSSSRICSNII